MKRILILGMLLLLLCGCGAAPGQLSDPTGTSTAADASEPAGCYAPDSNLEKATNGAVQVYSTGQKDVYDLALMGKDLLVFSGRDHTTITKLSGNNLYTTASAELDGIVRLDHGAVHTGDKGVVYFDEAKTQLVYLDTNLKEVNRVDIPGEVLGNPVLSSDRKTAYYCTKDALYAFDLENNLQKLLREMKHEQQSVVKLHLNDSVAECSVEDAQGRTTTLFLSTQNGQTIYESNTSIDLDTAGDTFFAVCTEGANREFLLGNRQGVTDAFMPGDQVSYAAFIPGRNAVVTAQQTRESESCVAAYYDLADGKRKAQLKLPGADYIRRIYSRGAEDLLWMLRYDPEFDCMVICRWDLTKSQVADDAVYVGKRYTADEPDADGLAECRKTADEMEQRYGIEIRLWQDATAFQPEDYTLQTAYQVPAIRSGLNQLDQALARYPDGFFEKTGSGSRNNRMTFCLVGSIQGKTPGVMQGLQYWDGENNAYIALGLSNEMERYIYHEIFHMIDNRVFASCSAYDNWEDLNPRGFQYDYNYTSYMDRDSDTYLEKDTRAFIDSYAMTYPTEDRARIMEYAMMEDTADYFASPLMQEKLSRICRGIRKAYDLTESTEQFPWEQYLKEPLSNTK